ncbi:MAG: Gfo/Idh/MocA family protein [Candidatus Binatia bacterium]
MDSKKIKIGIVGCGRAGTEFYVPACRVLPEVEIACVVDALPKRARETAERFDIAYSSDRYEDLFDRVDAAILAIPHHLHAPTAIDFLKRGIGVLCEKPLATSYQDALCIVEASESGQAVLAVSLMRRSSPGSRITKDVLDRGFLGPIQRADIEEGFLAPRPATAAWLYNKEQAGGGMLISNGIHALDLLFWWFNAGARVVRYQDDSFSGIEANASIALEVGNGTQSFPGTIELSLMRRLRNTVILTGAQGTLELPVHGGHPVKIQMLHEGREEERLLVSSEQPKTGINAFAAEVREFASAVAERKSGFITGRSHLEAMRVISDCYATRQLFMNPWERIAQ